MHDCWLLHWEPRGDASNHSSMHNNHLSFLFHLYYFSPQQKWNPNICNCFIHQNMFEGQDAFIFYGHIVNNHTSMKDVNHNAPIPLFTQFLDYAKKWLQTCQITIQHLFELFLVELQTISFSSSSTHEEFPQRLATLDDTID